MKTKCYLRQKKTPTRSIMAEKTRKGNFTAAEIAVLVGEVEARKNILFGGHSSGITNKRKTSEWQHIVTAVNSVSATGRSAIWLRHPRPKDII